IKMAGHKVAYVDSAVCITEGASTLKGFLNQRTRWRHGYIECLRHHKKFITSISKGKYLTFVDLPLQLWGVLEVFLFPVIFSILVYLLFLTTNYFALVAAYCLIPITLLMLGDLRKANSQVNAWVFAVPIMLICIEVVEYIALLQSIYRTILRRR